MPEHVTHQATGNPGILDGVASMAEELAEGDDVLLAAGGSLALIKLLAVELADALRRINELESDRKESNA